MSQSFSGYPSFATPFRISHHATLVGSAGIGWGAVPFGLQLLLQGIDIYIAGAGVGTTTGAGARVTPVGGPLTGFWASVLEGNFETTVYHSWRGAIPIYEADSVTLEATVSVGVAEFGLVGWGEVSPIAVPLLAPVFG